MFQVTEIVRFLLERGLRFRNLGFCGHNLINRRMTHDDASGGTYLEFPRVFAKGEIGRSGSKQSSKS